MNPTKSSLGILLLVLTATGVAQGQTWTGAVNGNWSNANNWSPASVPSTSSVNTQLTFGATANGTMTDDLGFISSFALNKMTFTAAAPAYSLGGNFTLNFDSNSSSVLPTITMNSNNAVTINENANLNNNFTVSGSGAGVLTFGGSVNTNGGTMTYSGAGALVLSGTTDNNNLGLTVNSGTAILAKTSSSTVHAIGGFGLIINGGTVQLGGTGGDQIYDGANVTMNGGMLDANGSSEAFATLNLGGFGALANNAAGTSSALSPTGIILSSDALMGATSSANLIINAPISGNHSLEIASADTGVVALNGTNSYTGVTDVVGGELDIPTIANGGANSPLGASSNSASNLTLVGTGRPSTLMLTGVNSTYSTDRGLTDSGGAIGVQNAGTTLTWNGQITGGGSLTKTGGGVLVLTNTSNNYQSGTYVEEGTLQTPATPPSHGVSADQVLPYERNVTVAAGARWLVTNAVVGNGIWVGDVSLEGGELDVTGEAQLYVTSLVADTPGSVVNLTGSAQLIFWGTPATARINADTTWSGDSLYPFVFDRYGDPIELIVAPGATLTSSVFLSPIDVSSSPFHISGGGTVYITTRINNEPADYVVYQGRLRADNLSVASDGSSVLGLAQAGFLTLDGGTLQYSGPTATSPMPITVTSNGGTLEVSNAATTLTYTGTLSGFGPFIKNGPGVLILDNLANAYASGITVSGGRIDVSDDAQLGAAIVTVNPAGTLRYTADATTARTFNLTGGKLEAPAGVTLTLSGAAVNGGFIRGAGTFVVTGGATLSAATTLNGTTINQTGAASFTDFTNGGVLNLAAGLPDPVSLDGFTNQGSGVVTVGAGSQVNASDFQSYGVVTLNPGSAATPTLLTATGGSAIYLNGGSRTYIGSAASPDPLSATLSGNIELNGGLLVNNGTVSGTVDINFGGLAKGVGTYGVVNVSLGGVFSPGNSPGIVTATQVTIGSTATPSGAPTLLMELAGTTPGTLYDQLHVTGQLSLGGLLEITLAPGFNPTSGNRFDLLDWGSLSGHFDSLSLPALSAGLAWNTTQLYVTGVLAVTDINLLPGDFNRDHHVDASDIVPAIVSLTNPTVYEAQYGVNATDLSIIGDLNADGRFTNADMQSLLNLLLSGGGSTTPVPEPSAFVMSILAFGVAAAMKYRSEFGSLPLSTLRLPSLPYSHKR